METKAPSIKKLKISKTEVALGQEFKSLNSQLYSLSPMSHYLQNSDIKKIV